MQINLFSNNQEIIFGVRYSNSLLVDGQHMLTLSFWKWDLEFEW